MHPKRNTIPYTVHYFWGPGSKVVHWIVFYYGHSLNKVLFRLCHALCGYHSDSTSSFHRGVAVMTAGWFWVDAACDRRYSKDRSDFSWDDTGMLGRLTDNSWRLFGIFLEVPRLESLNRVTKVNKTFHLRSNRISQTYERLFLTWHWLNIYRG